MFAGCIRLARIQELLRGGRLDGKMRWRTVSGVAV
jgi:hypothetical protein